MEASLSLINSPHDAFKKNLPQHTTSKTPIGDVSWLLRVSAPAEIAMDMNDLGLSQIASQRPILAILHTKVTVEEETRLRLLWLHWAPDNDGYDNVIMRGGVPPLLKLAKEGRMEGQETLGESHRLLGRRFEASNTICEVAAKSIADCGWAFHRNWYHRNRKCQDHFAQDNVIGLLDQHISRCETIQEHMRLPNSYQISKCRDSFGVENGSAQCARLQRTRTKAGNQSRRWGRPLARAIVRGKQQGKEYERTNCNKSSNESPGCKSFMHLAKGICQHLRKHYRIKSYCYRLAVQLEKVLKM
ncbi:hypothetical protein SDJN02_01839, partial [Cucurbita argyrosperma subsp. argyrosperma]